ncbi:hypothetical protein E2562_009611 [Oryza meyeriana var. granulata]|uniref:Uncharacterized protein n=1 Tax=Oryza meyeriana var. granulata TaxID=110450 RepID=A0A6G1BIZ1_9ORYZ|nr:hypothetical protein E2562_009611 [Oryza meyeriana var. granulata]
MTTVGRCLFLVLQQTDAGPPLANHDLARFVSNLKLVVFPNPYREDPGKALRDWDLWGPFIPVWDTVKHDLARFVSNLKLVVFPNPYREDPGKALRDWDLWGPFIVFLGLTLSWSASVKKFQQVV